MSKKFYVYIYYNPENMQPFYVGKGSKNRDTMHLSEARCWSGDKNKGVNWSKLEEINKIWAQNREPIITRVYESINEEDVKQEEIRLIKLFGRRFEGGLLTNIRDGGDGSEGLPGDRNGMYGKTHSETTKQKIREIRAQEKLNPNYQENKTKLNPRSKQVTDGVNVYNSLSEAARKLGFKSTTAARGMLKRGELWSINDKQPKQFPKKGSKDWSLFRASRDKRSQQITDGENIFPSINAAARHHNINPIVIQNQLNGKSTKFNITFTRV